MPDLVPIKVVLRHTNGDGSPRVDQNGKPTVYPSFRDLPAGVLGGRKPGEIIDKDGTGWRHDRVDNLGNGAVEGASVALVPPDFAGAAVGNVDSCTLLTEAECETFLDTRHWHDAAAVRRDGEALKALAAERELLVARSANLTAIDAEIDKALDPNDSTPGVRINDQPTSYQALKARKVIRVVPPT